MHGCTMLELPPCKANIAEYESASCILFSHQFQDEQFHVLLVNKFFSI